LKRLLPRLAISTVLALAAVAAPAVPARGDGTGPPQVNYISADAVYLNIGRRAGVSIGAKVDVIRNGRTIAVLEVVYVSSHSASCRVVEHTEAPRTGDAVVFTPTPVGVPIPEPAVVRTTPSTNTEPTVNVVSGYVEFQTVWQKDLTETDVSSLQPAIAARIQVKNVGGSGGDLRIRDRIRYYNRTQSPGAAIETSEWYHRLTELAFIVDAPQSNVRWGIGRLIAPCMVGIGLVDGGYISVALSRYFRVGAGGGLTPDRFDLSFGADRVQVGGFLALDYESSPQWRFTSSAALAGQYVSSTVSREFVYWQNALNFYRRFSLFQSVEIDLNRDWRRDAAGEDVTFSNFYLSANAEVSSRATIDFTYDSRKNVRVYETRETPDSLFDDVAHNGYRAGLVLRLPHGIGLQGYGGLRYRDGDRTNRYITVSASAVQLPWRGHSIWARYAHAVTRSVTGHRPSLSYRFPAAARLRLDVSAGGYIYDQGTRVTSSFYADLGAYYTFGRYFTSGSYRQYFGGGLESILFFAEIGVRL
jgi:hypothetical protein